MLTIDCYSGFSYEYLSPDNLNLPEAYVKDGVLAPARQAFKAMIVRGNDTLTVPGVQRLVKLAKDGLPIVFSGGVPQNLTGFSNALATIYVRETLHGMVGMKNVHIVPSENLASSLAALGLNPRTKVTADRTMYTYWREDANASTSYVFVYNDAWDSGLGEGSSTGGISFETTGVPYMYDAWTGAVKPILAYQQTDTLTTIPISLAGNQSMIIAFRHDETPPSGTRLLATSGEVFSATPDKSDSVTIKAGNTTEPVLLSNGTVHPLQVPAAAPMKLNTWTLIVESWTRPRHPYVDQTVAAKSNSTHQLTSLKPWNQISKPLRHVSGRGFYNTTFTWPPKVGNANGAMLDLGVIVNTAQVWVNGRKLPPLDPTAAVADIGSFLVHGKNTMEVIVTTTLGNALIPIHEAVRTSGTLWLGPAPIEQEYGLVMPVQLVPYCTTVLAL